MKDKEKTPITWCRREETRAFDRGQCEHLASELKLSPLFAQILMQRNLTSGQTIHSFLNPKLADLPSPLLMKDMDKAVDLVIEAFRDKKPIIIHGDYDVDGKSSTALLLEFLAHLDIETSWHLPDRISEGYGLHTSTIRTIAGRIDGPALLITVDCGINAHEAVALAKEYSFKVLITDHHEPPDSLPIADAILNPKQPDCTFPFKELAGVGVAFYLIAGIRQRLTRDGFWTKETAPNLKRCLDLVALGTVADVMPMTGINRILVRAGLEVLSERSRPGIWALCEKIRLSEGPITTEDISYRIAPRINAAGRVGNPETAVELFLSKTTAESLELAGFLEELNERRRQLEAEATRKALTEAAKQFEQGASILITYGNWHPGIIGIVCSRIVDQFNLPAIVFTDDTSENGEILKGSGRSITGLNLFETLNRCSEHVIQFGGHAMAAGLTIEKQNLEHFRTRLNQYVSSRDLKSQEDCMLFYDLCLMGPEDLTGEFHRQFQAMEPFGTGNPEPVFVLKNIEVERPQVIKNHLKFTVRRNATILNGIGFGLGDKMEITDRRVNLAFKLKTNTFRGERRLELQTIDIATTI